MNFFLITVNITKSLNPRCVLPPCLLLCPQKKKKTLTQKNLDSIEVQYFVSSTISSASVFWYSFAYRKGITKLRQFRISTFIKTINKLLGLHDFKNIYTIWTWLRWRRNSSFNRFKMEQDIYVHHKYEFPAHKGSENLTFQLRKQLQLLDCDVVNLCQPGASPATSSISANSI